MELSTYMQFGLALVFVLCLIWLCALAARRWQEKGGLTFRSTQRRMRIVEVLPVDGRRRAVLLRRDDKEHLLMIGGGNDILIETDIPSPPAPDNKTAQP